MKRNVIPAIWVLLVMQSLLPAAWAGTRELEGYFKSDYVGKVLTLRHFYHGDHLRFHSDGSLQGDASIGPWTVDGQISVQKVRIEGNLLEISGRRICVVFDAESKPVDDLTTLGSLDEKIRDDVERALRELEVRIEIELPRGDIGREDLASTMRAVFLATGESMMDIVPSSWRKYFAIMENRPEDNPDPMQEVYYIRPGNGVVAPRATYAPDPDYSEDARKAKYQGTTLLSLVVDPAGTTRDPQITKPVGMGLDEHAVAAVSKWKFEPALKDGKPVAVGITVQVSFRLY